MPVKLSTPLLILLSASPVRGQGQTPKPSDTAITVTGGDWSRGEYRVVVRASDPQHQGSAIRVEWLAARQGLGSVIVAADSTLPIPAGSYSLDAPDLVDNFEGWHISVCGTGISAGSKACWLIFIGEPGHVSLVRGPKRALVAQHASATIELAGGNSRLYHTDVYAIQAALMKPFLRSSIIEHRVGITVEYAQSDLATSTVNQRHLNGIGIRYSAVFLVRHRLSPFLGGSVQFVHASNTDNTTVGSQAQPTLPNPADATGSHAQGASVAGEAGMIFRVAGDLFAIGRGSVEHQSIYTDASGDTAFGISIGLGMAFH